MHRYYERTAQGTKPINEWRYIAQINDGWRVTQSEQYLTVIER
ncbi:hypothetical protein [uncultured Paraglaciecola sp.]|nr:hypothetical protein [uncultured Paraglaciecola sp.]